MNVYIFLLIIFIILAISFSRDPKSKAANLFFILSLCLLFVFTVLRNEKIGADTKTYYMGFIDIYNKGIESSFPYIFNWEIGYILYNKLITFFSHSYYAFTISVSFPIYISLYFFIKKYSPNPFVSLMVFICMGFYQQSMFVIRQWLAITVCLFSTKYVINRSFWKFVILMVLAFLFHRTALIFVPLYFVYGFTINEKTLLFYFAASILIAALGSFIIVLFSPIVRSEYEIGFNGGIPMYVAIILTLFLFYYFVFIRDGGHSNKLLCSMMIMAMLVQPLAFYLSNIARVTEYFSISMIIICPILIKGDKEQVANKSRFLPSFIMLVLVLGIFVINFNGDSSYNFSEMLSSYL